MAWFEVEVDAGVEFAGNLRQRTPLPLVTFRFAEQDFHWFQPNASATFKSAKPVVMMDLERIPGGESQARRILEEFLSVLAYRCESPFLEGTVCITGFPRQPVRPMLAPQQPNAFQQSSMIPPTALRRAEGSDLRLAITLHRHSLCANSPTDSFLKIYQALEIVTKATIGSISRESPNLPGYLNELADRCHLGLPSHHNSWAIQLKEIRDAIAHPQRTRPEQLHIDPGNSGDRQFVADHRERADKLFHTCVDEMPRH